MSISDQFSREQLAELHRVFEAEATEHVQALIVMLSRRQGEVSAAENIEQLSGAKHHLHILVGSAQSVGFRKIASMSHRLEIAVGALLDDATLATPEVFDGLLESLAMIQQWIDHPLPEGDKEGDQARSDQANAQLEKLNRLLRPASDKVLLDEENGPAMAGMKDFEITQEQLAQLCEVFRAEATEQLKGLAEVLFALDEDDGSIGPDDLLALLTNALRSAHSLKGSAGSLGFKRIAVIVHRFEDVLGLLEQNPGAMSERLVDKMLESLDVITQSVRESLPGDEQFTDEEQQAIATLERIAAKLAEGGVPSESVPAGTSTGSVTDRGESQEPAKKKAAPVGARSSVESALLESSKPPKSGVERPSRDGLIRIAESHLDSVIVQISELFETSIQFESFGQDLDGVLEIAQDSLQGLGAASRLLNSGGEVREDLSSLTERVRSLYFLLRAAAKKNDRNTHQLSRMLHSAQDELRKIRMAPISSVFVTIKRYIREISKETGKQVDLYLEGGEYTVDRKILEAIEEPLIHILRNAVDHGIEPRQFRIEMGKPELGYLSVIARHTGDAVELTIADDGKGIDPEAIRKALLRRGMLTVEQTAELSLDQLFDYLFEFGFSTQRNVSNISGRGMGLDVVKFAVERFGGEVRLDSRPGDGTALTMRLPLTMSMVRCLLVRVGDRALGIPASNVEKVLVLKPGDIRVIGDGEVIEHQGMPIAYCFLGELFGFAASPAVSQLKDTQLVVLVRFGERQFAFGIGEVMEYVQLILKPLGDLLERVPNVAGVSLLGSGELALVVNPADLVRTAGELSRSPHRGSRSSQAEAAPTILVVDDSIATRTFEKTLLESAGFNVVTAADGYKALDLLVDQVCDLVISDIQMPNMDGISLTRTIRAHPSLGKTPVVLLTSAGSDEDKARGLSVGADAYIVKKDLTQRELVQTINQLL